MQNELIDVLNMLCADVQTAQLTYLESYARETMDLESGLTFV